MSEKMKCADCGEEWDRTPLCEDGDVCQKCFDEFNGMTIEDMLTPSEPKDWDGRIGRKL